MAKFAELPDGTRLEFPDNTSDSIIDNTVKKHLGVSVSPKAIAGASTQVGMPEIDAFTGGVETKDGTGGAAFGAGFLNRALGLSRGLGGDVAESQQKSQQAFDIAAKDNPIMAGLGGMGVDALAAAPGLVASIPLAPVVGGGALGAMATEGVLGGLPAGLGRGGERYQEVLDKTKGNEEAARLAAVGAGLSGIADFAAPASFGGNLVKRFAGGSALNLATGEADIALQNRILKDYKDLQQEQFNSTNMAINAIGGGVFGAMGAKQPFRTETPSVKPKDIKTTEDAKAYLDQRFGPDMSQDGLIALTEQGYRNSVAHAEQKVKQLEEAQTISDLGSEGLADLANAKSELESAQQTLNKFLGDQEGKLTQEQITELVYNISGDYPKFNQPEIPEWTKESEINFPDSQARTYNYKGDVLGKDDVDFNEINSLKHYTDKYGKKVWYRVGEDGEWYTKYYTHPSLKGKWYKNEKDLWHDYGVQKEQRNATTKVDTNVPPEVDTLPPKVDVETPPRTDVEGSRIDEQPLGATVVSREEGINPNSDVPPRLQRDDTSVDGVDPTKVIPATKEDILLTELNSRISTAHDYLDSLNRRHQEYFGDSPGLDDQGNIIPGSGNRNSPDELKQIQAEIQRMEDALSDMYLEKGRILSETAKESRITLTSTERDTRANDLLQEALARGDSPETFAKNLLSTYATAERGTFYVGNPANRSFVLKTVHDLNKIIGQNDKLVIINSPDMHTGRYTVLGDTHFLFVSDVRKGNYDFLDNIPKSKVNEVSLLTNIAHEYGHYFHTKLTQAFGRNIPLIKNLEKAYANYVARLETNKVDTVTATPLSEANLGSSEYARVANYFNEFPDFFAETFSRALLHGKMPQNDFLKNLFGGLRKIANSVHDALAKMGITVGKQDFTSQFFNNYFEINAKTISSTSKSMIDNQLRLQLEQRLNDKSKPKVINAEQANRNISEWYKTNSRNDYVPLDHEKIVEDQKKMEDIDFVSLHITANIFGDSQVDKILGDSSPLIHSTFKAISNANLEAERMSHTVWQGAVDQGGWQKNSMRGNVLTTLKRVQDGESPAVVMKSLSDNDLAVIHDVFLKAFQEGLDYRVFEFDPKTGRTTPRTDEVMPKYGHLLNDKQKLGFRSIADALYREWMEVATWQTKYKKNVLPFRKGYYPSVRKGDYFVELRYNDVPVYRQHVRTEAEAMRIRKQIEQSGQYDRLSVSHGKNEDTRLDAEHRSNLENIIIQELTKRGNFTGVEQVEKLLDKLYERGGKLGKHHIQRQNILGYKGTELFKSDADVGKSFREAVSGHVEEYTNTLRKMMISRNTDPFFATPNGLDQSHPNAFNTAMQMRDMALSRVDSRIKPFDDTIRTIFDKAFFAVFRHESHLPAYDRAIGVLTKLFYTLKLTAKPAFWLGQALTSITSIRHILREANTISAMASAGKGTMNLIKPSKEFLDCVYYLAQNSSVFHPSLVNELNANPLQKLLAKSTAAEKIVGIISGQIPAQAADSFSRYWTSAMMFEHYKSKGLSGHALYSAVADATNNTMVQYGRQHRAPYLNKFGIVGDALAPLHTFSTAQIGNLVADYKHMMSQPGGVKKLQAMKPLLATVITTIMLGGVVGVPLVAEYEFARKVLGLEDYLPSIYEWAVGDSPQYIAHGMLNFTGFDMGSTMRWSPIVQGVIDGNSTIMDMFPAMKFAGEGATALYTLGKAATVGGVTTAKERQAAKSLVPTGPMFGLVDKMFFNADNRKFVPTGGRGYGLLPQTDKEQVASFLGTRTNEAMLESKRFNILNEKQQEITQETQTAVDLLTDSIAEKNPEKRKMALEAFRKLKVTPEQALQQIETASANRNRGLVDRFVFGAKGTGTSPTQMKKYKTLRELLE